MKTLAIRLEDDLHAQLTMVAQLGELTITDAIRQAIDQWIETKRSQPELAARASRYSTRSRTPPPNGAQPSPPCLGGQATARRPRNPRSLKGKPLSAVPVAREESQLRAETISFQLNKQLSTLAGTIPLFVVTH